MKKFVILALPALLLLGIAAAPKKETCPISGKPVDDAVSLNINGEKVKFCCDGCPKAYKKKIGLVADAGPGSCPISNNPAKAASNLIHRSAKTVYFCCNNCPKAFAKKNKLTVVDKGPKKCPLSGNPAKDAAGTSLVVNGEKMYFCCANCPKAYKKKLGVVDEGAKECVVSGKPAKAETGQILVSAKTVYFCCNNCPKKYIAQNFKKKDTGKKK